MDELFDNGDDEKCVEYIKNYLPQELKERFSDDQLYYFLDVINDYYVESGVLEAKPDKDGCVSIDLDAITDYVVKESKKDEIGDFSRDDIFFIVQGEMEYGNSLDEVD
jgi:hypothetical protein